MDVCTCGGWSIVAAAQIALEGLLCKSVAALVIGP